MAQAIVHIPPMWRPRAGGRREIPVPCGTIAEVIRYLAEALPDLRDWLLQPDGQWPEYLNVFVNDQDVRVLAGPDTVVGPGDQIRVVPAVAGGG